MSPTASMAKETFFRGWLIPIAATYEELQAIADLRCLARRLLRVATAHGTVGTPEPP